MGLTTARLAEIKANNEGYCTDTWRQGAIAELLAEVERLEAEYQIARHKLVIANGALVKLLGSRGCQQ